MSESIMIEAKGLCKFYGSFVAVQDISFKIPDGQIVAFLGPNGAGKSTTMKILSGYLGASAGSAAIAGLDVRRDRLAMSRHLGYLPENGPLYQNMTPLELLRFFGEARGMGPAVLAGRLDYVSRPVQPGPGPREAHRQAVPGQHSSGSVSRRPCSTIPTCSSWTSRPRASIPTRSVISARTSGSSDRPRPFSFPPTFSRKWTSSPTACC